jgi:hypothetical protein
MYVGLHRVNASGIHTYCLVAWISIKCGEIFDSEIGGIFNVPLGKTLTHY